MTAADRYYPDPLDEAVERFDRAHQNCPALAYECVGCGEPVCPDHDPSPREADEMCATCWWIADPNDEEGLVG